MYALPPKADIAERDCDVRSVLKADIPPTLQFRGQRRVGEPDYTDLGLTYSACDVAWRLLAVRHVGPPICPQASSRAFAALPFLPAIDAWAPALASTVC